MAFRRGLPIAALLAWSHAPLSSAVAQTGPSNRLRRTAAVTAGLVTGGIAGLLIGRRLARPSLCEGCITSTNHDRYIGGGLAVGALVGGGLAWYVTRPRHAADFRVGSPNLMRAAPSGDRPGGLGVSRSPSVDTPIHATAVRSRPVTVLSNQR